LFAEEADIRRVAVNRIVSEVPQSRQEGEVTIVPVVEEVLVVEKRLLLKEEIHIARKRAPVREPRRISADELRS
jgi:stress response protein YsnF